jgi:prepilin-type N-terminal cleavage/methylation domain-containing protein
MLSPPLSRRRRSFTLLELLVTLALVGAFAGLIANLLKGQWEEWRFRSSARQLLLELQKCQSVAMAYQHDVTLQLRCHHGSCSCLQRVDFKPCLLRDGERLALSGIHSFSCNKKPVLRSLTLRFLPSGQILPRSPLRFAHGTLRGSIDLSSLQLTVHIERTDLPAE